MAVNDIHVKAAKKPKKTDLWQTVCGLLGAERVVGETEEDAINTAKSMEGTVCPTCLGKPEPEAITGQEEDGEGSVTNPSGQPEADE